MDVLYRITLRRPDVTIPWGFKLKGGQETDEPLTFREVYQNSIADNCGVRRDDRIVALAGSLTRGMSNAEVQDVLLKTGDSLEIIVERPTESKHRRGDEPLKEWRHQFEKAPLTDFDTNHDLLSSNKFDRTFFDVSASTVRSPKECIFQGNRMQSSPLSQASERRFTAKLQNDCNISDNEEYLMNPTRILPPQFGRGRPADVAFPPLFRSKSPSLVLESLDDRLRKVRFAEPPESSVLELESISSYAPSVDWDPHPSVGWHPLGGKPAPFFGLSTGDYFLESKSKVNQEGIFQPAAFTMNNRMKFLEDDLEKRFDIDGNVRKGHSASSVSYPYENTRDRFHRHPEEFSKKKEVPVSMDECSSKIAMDPAKAGLFAVLDRSVTDKIMNWNRPPNLENSATLKLLKELEEFRDGSYEEY